MANSTPIGYADSTANWLMGCAGCELWQPTKGILRCYAGRMIDGDGHRLGTAGRKGFPRSFRDITYFPERFAEALAWPDLTGTARLAKPWLDHLPRVVFHVDMGDAWSERPEGGWEKHWLGGRELEALGRSPHVHLLLTKRPRHLVQWSHVMALAGHALPANVWPGTSVPSAAAIARAHQILQVEGGGPRWVSYEPASGELSLDGLLGPAGDRDRVSWVVFGGESGRDAEQTHLDWARRIRDQCADAGAAFFMKQTGARSREGNFGHRAPRSDPRGEDFANIPEDLRTREMPVLPGQYRPAPQQISLFAEAR